MYPHICDLRLHRKTLSLALAPKLLHTQHYPVPDHEEVEANEEPQHSAYIRHQGEGGVGGHLPHHLELRAHK